ncbi:hypothetical protein RJ639_032626 [Escallonia herrerae]|uniref:Uncharacterized protein n=1 Tax=Escallonia herrerae TaxID=1293975 RepID=A0AA88WXD6_9ASTE|nr:hypothetical protein RJ639_032626 [Escallonia herrerae]
MHVPAPSPVPFEAGDKSEVGEPPEIREIKRHHSHAVAGGDVILGGLATAMVAAVFCYIRVTRKHHDSTPPKTMPILNLIITDVINQTENQEQLIHRNLVISYHPLQSSKASAQAPHFIF